MRDRLYLRTPMKAYNFSSLAIQEVAFKNDFGSADPCPQAIEISFVSPAGQSQVEIALVWDGQLRFLPDSNTLPASQSEVTEANYPNWNLTGTLILSQHDSSSGTRIRSDVPLLKNWPTTARYEKVTLTRPFLFTTLRRLQNLKFKHNNAVIDQTSDQRWFEKFVVEFLHGRVSCFCNLDSVNPANDFTELPMPIVAGSGVGSSFKLHFSCASRDLVTLFPSWFDSQPYDNPHPVQPDVSLVPLSLRSEVDLSFNTRHPGHSIIPPRLIFASAPDDAWATAYLAHPIRAWARTSLPAGQSYRRIELLRTLSSAPPPSLDLTRPYPLHQLAWQRVGASTTEAFRIPLDGYIYAPLADADYKFWTIPRGLNANVTTTGDEFRLAEHVPPAQPDGPERVGPTQENLTQTLTAGATQILLYADIQRHDSLRVWTRLKNLGNDRVKSLQDQANARWGIWDRKSSDSWHHPNIWIIDPKDSLADYAPIYGYIIAAANRHGLAAEFVHAVFMGEGGIKELDDATKKNPTSFDPRRFISAYGYLGLDLIIYRLGMNEFPPPLALPEYTENLVELGYVDISLIGDVSPAGPRNRVEGGGPIVVEAAAVQSWETAIELVAAELHFRMDQMIDFCVANGISITTEEQRRFLAYMRFIASEETARTHALRINSEMTKWSSADDPKPPKLTDSTVFDRKYRRYETLRRLAVTEWYEAAGVYR